MQILSYLDIFGSAVQLRFNNKVQNSTAWGGFITLCITGAMIAGLAWYGQDVVNRNNPQSLYLEESTNMPERMMVSADGYNFAFGLQDPNSFQEYRDQSYYTIKIRWQKYTQFFNQTSNNFELLEENIWFTPVNCTQDHFVRQDTENYFSSLPQLQGKSCISLEDLERHKPYIEGDFGSDRFAVIQIQIFPCYDEPDAEVQKCQPRQQVEKTLIDTYFAIYYPDNLVQLNSYEKPFRSYGRDYFSPASLKQKRYQILFLRNYYIKTDIGFLLEDFNTIQDVVQVKEVVESLVYRDEADKTSEFFVFTLRMEKSQNSIYLRKYKKIQNLVPELGGLLKILTTMGFLICWPFSLLNLKLNMVKSHYDIKYTPKEDIFEKQNEIHSEPNQDINLQFTILDYFLYYMFPFFQMAQKKKLLDTCQNQLIKHLDTQNLTRKMVDIQKVKLILMDDNQIELFDYIPQPVILAYEITSKVEQQKPKSNIESIHQSVETALQIYKKQDIYHQDERDIEVKTRTAFKAIKEIYSKQTRSEMDQQLVSLLDPKILEAFKRELSQEPNFNQNSQDISSQPNIQINISSMPDVVVPKVLSQVLITQNKYQDETPYISPRQELQDNENIQLNEMTSSISGVPHISSKPKQYIFNS